MESLLNNFLSQVDEGILFVNTNIYPHSHKTVFFQSDVLDQHVQTLADLAQLDASQLKFVLSLFLVYVLGVIYRFLPAKNALIRHIYNLLLGVWLLQFCLVWIINLENFPSIWYIHVFLSYIGRRMGTYNDKFEHSLCSTLDCTW